MTKIAIFTFGLFAVNALALGASALLGIDGLGQFVIAVGAGVGYLQATLG